ncbi:ketopantoate reductase family protein [Kerstersia gyiorum]|uniref:ketopantoate reductase family protein n=1 Tax=Kerstersia gyiorum TaxID=206506 RepID=UPI0039EC3BE2
MKIAIIGAGAMGSLFGGLLARTCQPILYDLNQAHVDAMRAHGLRMSFSGQDEIAEVTATSDPSAVPAMDAVILFVKSPHTRAALLDGLQRAITPDTQVISLQNGLGNIEVMRELLAPTQIVQGFSTLTSDLAGPGHIHVTCDLNLHTAMWPLTQQPDVRLQELCQLMNQAGLQTVISDQVERDVWMKLLVNASLNSLFAITRQNVGHVVDHPGTRRILESIVYETADIANAKGLGISRQAALQHVLHVAEKTRGHVPSMATDVFNRRPTEIEAINGAIVRAGQALHIPAPATEWAAHLVRCLENYDHWAA